MSAGERRLAAAVLLRAAEDLKYATSRKAERREWARDAHEFLTTPSPLLDHWCQLAGVTPEEVLAWACTRRSS